MCMGFLQIHLNKIKVTEKIINIIGGTIMCGFAGFLNFKADFLYNEGMYEEILENMCTALYHRGQDEKGKILTKEYGLAHTRLSIIDIENGKQPMTAKFDNNTYRIVYNGEIYNTKEIREEQTDYRN